MRKRTIRSGMRLLLAALLLIILATFYHGGLGHLLSLNPATEQRYFGVGMFAAAALGGYAVVMAVIGLVLPADYRDVKVRILPVFIMLFCAVALFFYLFLAPFSSPVEEQPLRPGTAITI
jgi:hypothetical protein